MPNCVYLRGTGKTVSVVIFFFTNKAVARASHACRINAGSNEDYLVSSCFESIEILFRRPARGSGCRCFLFPTMDTGEGRAPAATPALQASRHLRQPSELSRQQPAAAPWASNSQVAAPRATTTHKTTLWLTKCLESGPLPLGAVTLLLLRAYPSSSNSIMYPWWAQATPEEGVKHF